MKVKRREDFEKAGSMCRIGRAVNLAESLPEKEVVQATSVFLRWISVAAVQAMARASVWRR